MSLKGKLKQLFGNNRRSTRKNIAEKGNALSALLQRTSDFDLTANILQTNRFRRAIRPTFVTHPEGKRLVVFAPHQDDEIIGCGGLFLNSIAAGLEITPIYVTDGTTSIPGKTKHEVIELRRLEAINVWNTLGGIKPVFWDLPSGKIPVDNKTGKEMSKLIERFRPDCLFIPFFLEDPNDHRKINHLLWLTNKIRPLPDIEVWAYQITTMICPNVAVDITNVIDKKEELMQMWKSQNDIFNYAHQSRGMNAANSQYYKGTLPRPHKPYVELFFVVRMAEYLELLNKYFGKTKKVNIYGIKKTPKLEC